MNPISFLMDKFEKTELLKKTVKELKRLVSSGKLDGVEDALDLLKNVWGFNDYDAQYYYGKFWNENDNFIIQFIHYYIDDHNLNILQ